MIQSFVGPVTELFMEPQPFMPGCVQCDLFWGELKFVFHWSLKEGVKRPVAENETVDYLLLLFVI